MAEKEYDAFLSHNWGANQEVHARVEIINNELKKLEYITWMDVDRMEGSVHKAMASGVEQSKMALIFVTKEYETKVAGDAPKGCLDSCYLEFKHCVSKLTPDKMLCVLMENEMSRDDAWLGVLGMHMTGRMYVNMSGNLNDAAYLQSKMKELTKSMDGIIQSSEASNSAADKGTQRVTVTKLDEELHNAAWSGSLSILKMLLNSGANVNAQKDDGTTVLHLAVMNNQIDMAIYLAENHSHLINFPDNGGAAPLHSAAWSGSVSLMEVLQKHGADFSVRKKDGCTALTLAAMNKQVEAAEYLAKNHPHLVDLADNSGATPLHSAAWNGSVPIIKILLDHGADINLKKNDGATALTLALCNNQTDVVNHIQQYHQS